MWHDTKTERAYLRHLPGRGFVAIDVTPTSWFFSGRRYRGSLIVERRSAQRRHGHAPPVIAEASGGSVESVIQQLLPTAECNPAIASALLRLHPVAIEQHHSAGHGSQAMSHGFESPSSPVSGVPLEESMAHAQEHLR